MNINIQISKKGKQVLFFATFIAIVMCFSSNVAYETKWQKKKIDTIQGYFLYEVDAPSKCFARFDQIEQGNNLIYFDTLIGKSRIGNLYEKGVFLFEYQPLMYKYATSHEGGVKQNRTSIQKFSNSIDADDHKDDSVYRKNLYYDSNKVIAYKKVYAKFVIISMGKLEQMIPVTENYKCCFSNKKAYLNTFFIIDVLNFIVY